MSRRHPEDPPGYNRRWPADRPVRTCSIDGCGKQCRFSLALDNGIRRGEWVEDQPVPVEIIGAFNTTRLAPGGTR